MRAVFLDSASLLPHTQLDSASLPFDPNIFDISLSALEGCFESLTLLPAFKKTPENLNLLQEAQVLITNKVLVNDQLLNCAPNVRLVCVAATGINNVDIAALNKRKIALTNVAGYSTPSVVQTTFQLLLSLVNKWNALQTQLQQHTWPSHHQFSLLPFGFSELRGKNFGIIGNGNIGAAVAKVARAFGMEVLLANLQHRPAKPDRLALDEFLSKCDVVSLHCPQVVETEQLVNKTFLRQMKTSALLINTARGGLIEENALAAGLTQGTIAGAGLDVLSTEPPDANNPLLSAPNCLITPHIGWASIEARQRLVDEIAANIIAFKQQKQRNRII